jgi:hemolysin activation/secretion protein
MPGRDDVRVKLMIGAGRNGLPVQDRFYLGGPLLLRAYPVHGYAGDRLLAATLDYFVGYDLFGMMGLERVQLQFVPFGEIGAVWSDDNQRRLWNGPESADWISDAGLGIQRNVLMGISARFDLAYRLDRSCDRFTWRFRFQTPLFDRLE